MPDVTAVIDRHQRYGLYELIRSHLGSVGDLWHALAQESDFAKAERLGRELGEDLRLLDDIGWKEDEGRGSFALTMPPDELARALRRLRDEAAALLTGSASERESREAEAEIRVRFKRGIDACKEVLLGIGGEGESA